MESWMIILAIIGLAIAGIFAFTGLKPNFSQQNYPIQLNAAISSNQIQAGEEIKASASAFSAKNISSIVFQVNEEKKTINCSSNSCAGEFSKSFDKPGAYTISITAIIDEKNFEQRKFAFYVFDKQKCTDGTFSNECSSAKPFFCSSGILAENCSKCGCIGESICQQNGKCSFVVSLKIISAKINDFNSININRPFNTIIELFNNSGNPIPKNTKLKFDLVFFNLQNTYSNSYNFILDNDLDSNSSAIIEVKNANNSSSRFFIPQTGNFDFNAQLFDENNRQLSIFSQKSFLNSVNDSSPPAKPSGLTASVSGKNATISWNKNSEQDIAGYNIFMSNGVSTFVVTSSKIASVSFNENVFTAQDLNSGAYFFTITAFDAVGNESVFSDTAAILIG